MAIQTSRPTSILILHDPRSRRGVEARRFLAEKLSQKHPHLNLQWCQVLDTPGTPECPDRVIVMGGDGTIRLAMNWLSTHDIKVPVGLIPAGTGNNLAQGLGIPLDFESSSNLAIEGLGVQSIDTLQVSFDGRSMGKMLQIFSTGLPAIITHRFEKWRKTPLVSIPVRYSGDYFYRFLAIQALLTDRKRRFPSTIEIENERFSSTGPAIFVGNEATIGGGFKPCPQALLDDGLLDICILPEISYFDAFHLFNKVSTGEHLDTHSNVVYRQARKIKLTQEPLPVLIDGDIAGSPEIVDIEVIPGDLSLISSKF